MKTSETVPVEMDATYFLTTCGYHINKRPIKNGFKEQLAINCYDVLTEKFPKVSKCVLEKIDGSNNVAICGMNGVQNLKNIPIKKSGGKHKNSDLEPESLNNLKILQKVKKLGLFENIDEETLRPGRTNYNSRGASSLGFCKTFAFGTRVPSKLSNVE
eukprot:Pgem_evm1s5289